MSVIGKKPFINVIIDELLADEVGIGKDVLIDLISLSNQASTLEALPIDFTNPLETIYNYEELGSVCSATYASVKLSEGVIKRGFLVVAPIHTVLFAFGKNEENMECYDLVWTKYKRSYTAINESLDANEFRREIALQGTGEDLKPIVLVASGTMQTSTLPAIVVPKLVKQQIEAAISAMSRGQAVVVVNGDGQYFVNEVDTEANGIRMVYQKAYLDYYLEGNDVVVEHVELGGGGTKLYAHQIKVRNDDENFDRYLHLISTQPTAYNNVVALVGQFDTGGRGGYHIIFAAVSENILYGDGFLYAFKSVGSNWATATFDGNVMITPMTSIISDSVIEL